ncbi:MAG: hypothetical protein CVU35_06240 [Betaproteobacteria bacterium HGW-Betaproteobacteria-8]|nr:MAG: hypothetical protein CVU35_06240 [Betaproteobacteria bacterium HGW-Betaproteobacteria-8]
MPYLLRAPDGRVTAVAEEVNAASMEGWESVSEESDEYRVFLENQLSLSDAFRESDIHMARVLEDLIDLLIVKDVIHFMDLPEPARKRLLERQAMRKSHLSQLVDDDKDGLI